MENLKGTLNNKCFCCRVLPYICSDGNAKPRMVMRFVTVLPLLPSFSYMYTFS